jgi:hypothetical protein
VLCAVLCGYANTTSIFIYFTHPTIPDSFYLLPWVPINSSSRPLLFTPDFSRLLAMSTVAVVLPCPVADRRPSRPLPSIPTSQLLGSSKTLPSLPNESHHVPKPKSRPITLRSSSTSLAYTSRMTPISLVSVLQEPRILASFLRYVHWDDFQSLALTCTACTNVLQHPKLRDVVLSAFVPSYWYCLRHADVDSPSNIAVQFSNLSRFSEYSI